MKKIAVVILDLILALGLLGCGNKGDTAQPDTTPDATPTVTADVTAEPTVEPTEEPAPAPENPVIRLSTTTSVNDSGLLSYLQPYFD